MNVIGFFRNLTSNLGGLIEFINEPLDFIGLSVVEMFSVGIAGLLATLCAIHLVRLFVGG